MFADSFCDSGWSNGSHRGWTTLVSFALQALVVACLLLLPLLYTQGLPRLTLLSPLLAPAPPAALPPAPPRVNTTGPQSNMVGIRLLEPSEIPRTVNMVTETVAPPPMLDVGAIGISHATGDPSGRGTVLNSIMGSGQVLPPASASGAPPAGFAHDGREPHPSRSTGLPTSGAAGEDSGTSGSTSHDQSRRHDRESAGAQWPSHAGASRRGCGAAVAIPSLRAQWRAGGSGNRGKG